MRAFILLIFLFLLLTSCGKAISEVSLSDQKEHSESFNLNKGDKIRFWSKVKYKAESVIDLSYTVNVLKDNQPYKIFNIDPSNVNPKYLSSDTRWIKSKERNPDWVKKPGCSFDLIRFKWIRDEDTRADHEKNRFIYTYGVKKNIKGKNTPVFVIEETGNYTFIMKLNSPYYTKKNIKKMDVILRR